MRSAVAMKMRRGAIRLLPLGLSVAISFGSGAETGPARSAQNTPDLSSFLTPFENRVDLDGDGGYDSYWTVSAAGGTCTLSLFDIAGNRRKWSVTAANCQSVPVPPVFYTRSFMGDSKRDFSLVIRPQNGAGYTLLAGDGANGQLRDLRFDLGGFSRDAVARINGTAVVDFKIAKYPGPALFVRGTGGESDQRGHLFYFPAGETSYMDLTEKSEVIRKDLFRGYPFPGVDIAGMDSGKTLYAAIYDDFNKGLAPCRPFKKSEAPGDCGVPDGNSPSSPIWNKGNGNFLDKVAVGDVDQDGADDLMLTYLWRSTIYPARPKGDSRFLGAPQYDNYYNPQGDAGGCHSGRHYGLSVLAKTGLSRFLSTIDIAGMPVGRFSDPYQNVSRNVAVIKADVANANDGLQRTLAWNVPMGTSIPGCASANLYSNALHYPADGLLRDAAGTAQFVHVNRWTQVAPAKTSCVVNDLKCYAAEMYDQSGYWSWEVRRVADGHVVKTMENVYVWDGIPIPGTTDIWILFSTDATIWNLGELRKDLALARLNTKTLAISDRQAIGVPARPFLKTQHWQSLSRAVSSNWPATRLFTLPRQNAPPSFVLTGATGNLVYSFRGSSWAND